MGCPHTAHALTVVWLARRIQVLSEVAAARPARYPFTASFPLSSLLAHSPCDGRGSGQPCLDLTSKEPILQGVLIRPEAKSYTGETGSCERPSTGTRNTALRPPSVCSTLSTTSRWVSSLRPMALSATLPVPTAVTDDLSSPFPVDPSLRSVRPWQRLPAALRLYNTQHRQRVVQLGSPQLRPLIDGCLRPKDARPLET